MKTGRYKDKIISIFKKAHVLSIADIKKKIKEADFSTIFRNVEMLCRQKVLKKIVINEDVTVYELADATHHHDHFICTECGEVGEIYIEGNVLDKKTKAKIVDVVVRGVCGPCNT